MKKLIVFVRWVRGIAGSRHSGEPVPALLPYPRAEAAPLKYIHASLPDPLHSTKVPFFST
jgi:hypothetical protein